MMRFSAFSPAAPCTPRLLAAAAAAALLVVSTAQCRAQNEDITPPVDRVLLDRALRPTIIRLVSIDANTIHVTDEDGGQPRALPRAEILAILPVLEGLEPPNVPDPRVPPLSRINPRPRRLTAPPPAVPAPTPQKPGRLELTDGAILPGTLVTTEGAAQRFRWSSRVFGLLDIPLDAAAAIVLNIEAYDALPSAGAPMEDAVLLRNGDRVEGFVASLGTAVIIEKAGKPVPLPLDRVDAIRLANPTKPATGLWVWLDDSAFPAASVVMSSDAQCTVAAYLPGMAAQPSAVVDADLVRALCFDTSALQGLATLPLTVSANPQRRWTPPPVIGDRRVPLSAPDIELSGPMQVSWTLPPASQRFAATIELPPSAQLWGDCDVLLETIRANAAPAQAAHERLNNDHPSAVINISVSGAATLRLTITPGERGPIGDKVVIRRGLILTAPSPAPAPAPPGSSR